MAATAINPATPESTRQTSCRNPLALWHLLSLDAPTVAVLWTWFLARSNRVFLPFSAVLAMGTAVWILYALDRLLDARLLDPSLADTRTCGSVPLEPWNKLEERHFFHGSNRRLFSTGIVFSSVALTLLLPSLPPESVRLYVVLGILVLGYFILIHAGGKSPGESMLPDAAKRQRLPKEIAVGVFFSAATFIPTISRQPALRPALVPGACLFALLCSLNCLFIYAWEHPAASPLIQAGTHPTTRAALQLLPFIAVAAATLSLLVAVADRFLPWQIPAACTLSAVFLLVVHRLRENFAATTLRAVADLCLLTPLLLLPLLPR